jgi:hypothetical protein
VHSDKFCWSTSPDEGYSALEDISSEPKTKRWTQIAASRWMQKQRPTPKCQTGLTERGNWNLSPAHGRQLLYTPLTLPRTSASNAESHHTGERFRDAVWESIAASVHHVGRTLADLRSCTAGSGSNPVRPLRRTVHLTIYGRQPTSQIELLSRAQCPICRRSGGSHFLLTVSGTSFRNTGNV